VGGHGQCGGPGAHGGGGFGVGVAGGLGDGAGVGLGDGAGADGLETATGFGCEGAGVDAGVVGGVGVDAGALDGVSDDGRAGTGRGTPTAAVDESATERRTAHLTRPQ